MAISITRKREMNQAIVAALFDTKGQVRDISSGNMVQLTHAATYGIENHKEVMFGFMADRDICVNALRLNKTTGEVELSNDMLCPTHNTENKPLITLLKDFEDIDGNYVWGLITYI